jgi:hypothetical protein
VSEDQRSSGDDDSGAGRERGQSELDETAARIAERGRDALVQRLRPAFREAAAAHADLLDLSDEQIEEMVQRAADRADGLQWRRALAWVATEDLHLSLGEALGHPAVARAHELLGVPSYEESLAALGAGFAVSETPAGSPPSEASEGRPPSEASDGSPPSEASTTVVEPWEREAAGWERHPQAAPADEPQEDARTEIRSRDQEPRLTEQETEPEPYEADDTRDDIHGYEEIDELRIAAIHLGGIANLSEDEPEVELRLAEPGLDIIRINGEVLGRLEWEQIDVLEVPEGRRRLRRSAPTHLVIRTARGDASFEVPGVGVEELRDHLAPILSAYLPRAPGY